MKKTVKKSGGARLKEEGKSLVWVTLDEAQKKKIRMAAAVDGVPMSQFLINHGLVAAERILEKERGEG